MLSTLECEGGVIVLNDKYNMLLETILDVLHYVSYLTHRSESGATRVPILITYSFVTRIKKYSFIHFVWPCSYRSSVLYCQFEDYHSTVKQVSLSSQKFGI